LVQLEVQEDAAGAGHQPPLVLHAELAFGEPGDLTGELLPGGDLHPREAAVLKPPERLPVLEPHLTNADLTLERAEIQLCHDGTVPRSSPGSPRSRGPRSDGGREPSRAPPTRDHRCSLPVG